MKMFEGAPEEVMKYFKNFSCGKTKTKYLIEYGLAPHYKSLLKHRIQDLTIHSNDRKYFVVCFDETGNYNLQRKQLDFHIRYWHGNEVVTRYLQSEFLGRATAIDLLACFKKLDQDFSLKNMIQISMDGPNVNLLTHKKVNKDPSFDQYEHFLLDIGTCGLHKVHNAMKDASKSVDWKILEFLRAAFTLFEDAPSRREEFLRHTRSAHTIPTCAKQIKQQFPLRFCGHRWVENIGPAKRMIDIFPKLLIYVTKIESKTISRKELTAPTCASYTIVKQFVLDDPFGRAKLEFLCWFARPVEIFLTRYQTDIPMVPFLVKDLHKMCRTLCESIVYPKVLRENSHNILGIDFTDNDVLKNTSLKLDSILAEETLMALKDEGRVDEGKCVTLREEARKAIITFLTRITTKSPTQNELAVHLGCLDPERLVQKKDWQVQATRTSFARVLSACAKANLIERPQTEPLMDEFDKLLRHAAQDSAFKDFKRYDSHTSYQQVIEDNDDDNDEVSNGQGKSNDVQCMKDKKKEGRLDVLYFNHYKDQPESKLWPVISMLLVLSHGQASVERGFSVNRQVTEVNQSEFSLQARRTIKDHITFVGGVNNVEMTPELLNSCGRARGRYETYLANLKKEKGNEIMGQKRRKLTDQKAELSCKRRKLDVEVEKLKVSIDNIENVAFETNTPSMFRDVCVQRQFLTLKNKEVEDIDSEINVLTKKLQNI
ncbi:unnamed protein product [Meganyctiphanes norvegica]|uniref:HAT C-terminal dimerisation domain-containing protein n=1 Tax=Meganyctiphanes norvegica TaxID=48144 RepID=A0AAV2QV20_MEGNR